MFSVINPVNVWSPVNIVDGQSCILKYPMIYPALTEQNPSQRVTTAEKMTVYETSIWIWTLSYNNGWLEAEWYSRNFQNNDVTGNMLPSLSLHMLQHILGIKNPDHRLTIKSAIDFLFPNAKKKEQFKAPKIGLGEISQGCVGSNDELGSLNSLTFSTGGSADDMSESVSSTIASLPRDNHMTSMIQVGQNTVSQNRCLILSLSPDQEVSFQETDQLKSRFAEFNYNVEILPTNSKSDSYIVIFDDELNALKARAQSKAIGYNLAKYGDRQPSPRNLVRFKALIKLKVRAGMSLNDRKIGSLKKNQIVTVNQVEGRRARVIFFQDKELMNSGWVSLHSETGTTFLERLE